MGKEAGTGLGGDTGIVGCGWKKGLQANFVKFHIPLTLQTFLSTGTHTYMYIYVYILGGGERRGRT